MVGRQPQPATPQSGPPRRRSALAVLGVIGAIALVVGVGAPSPDDNEERVEAIHRLRAAAPDEVAGTWASLDDPLQEFQAVLDSEGVTWDDLENGVEPEPAVLTAMQRLDDAMDGYDVRPITHHANDGCGLHLTELYNEAAGRSERMLV